MDEEAFEGNKEYQKRYRQLIIAKSIYYLATFGFSIAFVMTAQHYSKSDYFIASIAVPWILVTTISYYLIGNVSQKYDPYTSMRNPCYSDFLITSFVLTGGVFVGVPYWFYSMYKLIFG